MDPPRRLWLVRRVLAALLLLLGIGQLSMLVRHTTTSGNGGDATTTNGRTGGGGPLLLLQPLLETTALTTNNLRGETTTTSLDDVRRDDGPAVGNRSSSSRPLLPPWINNYASWHNQQLQQMNESNWKQFRYLVFRCLHMDAKCGGASDRLQPIPTYGLLLANQTKRILMIEWTRPCRLEEFLVPPPHGINWTVPSYIQFEYPLDPTIIMSSESELAFGDEMLVDVRHQSNDHGRPYYDQYRDDPVTEPNFVDIYRRAWDLLFVPSPAVALALKQEQRHHRLVPDHYLSVHVRAMYAQDRGGDQYMVRNAIRCARKIRPDPEIPIYFASDSTVASSYAIKYGRQVKSNVVARVPSNSSHRPPPLHLDRGRNFLKQPRMVMRGANDWMNHPNASDYYDTFVDLYLLAGGTCTSYNIGTYGRWANLLSSNSNCSINHRKHKCN